MELLCLAGVALSLAATLLEAFRDSLVFFCLWVFYLSLYQVRCPPSVSDDCLGFPCLTCWLSFQVGQVFLYFQWWVFGSALLLPLAMHSPKNVISCCCFYLFSLRDNLLLETGFLCILVAPLTLIRGSRGVKDHDRVTFWLIRWLLFRLMFASGVVKLTSRCPTWWGLTGACPRFSLPGKCGLLSSPPFRCFRQRWRTTTRPSASQRRWPGLPTSCQCGGKSWAWSGPSWSRSPSPCCSSAQFADYDLGLSTCRWVEIQEFCPINVWQHTVALKSCWLCIFHASVPIRVAGFASSSDHFVGKLQFLQPPDFDPLSVTSGRSTRSLLVTQEVHQQRQWYIMAFFCRPTCCFEDPGFASVSSHLFTSLFRLRLLVVALLPVGVGGVVSADCGNYFVLRLAAGYD